MYVSSQVENTDSEIHTDEAPRCLILADYTSRILRIPLRWYLGRGVSVILRSTTVEGWRVGLTKDAYGHASC